MRQILFEIPGLGFRVYSFSLFMALGGLSGLLITAWRAKREKIDPESVYELAVWLLSGGFIGARILYLIQYPEAIHGPLDVFKVWQGGIVFYGCIIGGLIGTMIYYFRRPFPFLPMADAVACALAIGVTLGRVGCWLNGCCFGSACRLPWAETFPAGSLPWQEHVHRGLISPHALQSLPIHPTQLYMAMEGLILLAVMMWYYPKRRRDGEVMGILMVGYAISRFFTEQLRADDDWLFLGFTLSQIISAILLTAGIATWVYILRKPPGRYADREDLPVPATPPRTATRLEPAAR